MQSKQYLLQIKIKTEKIEELEDNIKRLRRLLDVNGISYDREVVTSSVDTDRASKIICDVVSKEKELKQRKLDLLTTKMRILEDINVLDNHNHKKILSLMYVDLKSLGECAKVMSYSYTHVRRLRDEALDDFENTHYQSGYTINENTPPR